MKKIIFVSLIVMGLVGIVTMAIIPQLKGEGKEQPAISASTFTLYVEEGDVYFKTEDENIFQKTTQESIDLETGTFVKTETGLAHIIFPDNSMMSIDANTELQIRIPDDKSKISIIQSIGRTWHRVKNLNGKEYTVEDSTTLATVRGTRFAFENPSNKSSEVYVLESIVEVSEIFTKNGTKQTNKLALLSETEYIDHTYGYPIEVSGISDTLKASFWYKRNEIIDNNFDLNNPHDFVKLLENQEYLDNYRLQQLTQRETTEDETSESVTENDPEPIEQTTSIEQPVSPIETSPPAIEPAAEPKIFKITSLTSPSAGRVSLNWELTGYEEKSGYKVVFSTNSNPEYPNDHAKHVTGGDQRSATFSHDALADGGTFHFRICRYDTNKCDLYSNDAVVQVEQVRLFEITSLTSPSPCTVSLTWKLTGYEEKEGYFVLFSKNENPEYPTTREGDYSYYINNEDPNNASFTHKSFQEEGGTFHFRVCRYDAEEGECDLYSNDVTVDIQDSWGIPKFTLSGETERRNIELNWTVGKDDNTSKGFKIVWSTQEDPTYPRNQSPASSPVQTFFADIKSFFTGKPSGDSTWGYRYIEDGTTSINLSLNSGTWHFRIGRYRGGYCDYYSTDLTLEITD